MKTFWKAIGVGALALVAYCYGMNVGMNSIIDQISPEECRRLLKNRKVGMEVRTLRPDLVAKEREYEAEQRREASSILDPFARLFDRTVDPGGKNDTYTDALLDGIQSGRIKIVIEKQKGPEGTA